MKSLRMFGILMVTFAAMVMLTGCGDSPNLTAAGPSFDTTPPPAPAELTLSNDGVAHHALVWEASPAADVIGYTIYKYSPSPERDNAYLLISDGMVTGSMFPLTDAASAPGIYRVRAVDSAGNTSAFSAAVTVMIHTPGGGTHDEIANE